MSPPVILPKFKPTPNFPVPKCSGFQIAKSWRNQEICHFRKIINSIIGKYEVGYFVSEDQLIVTTGCLPIRYVHEVSHPCFHGGTIFQDTATGIIWIENQVLLGAGENVMEKNRF